MKGRLRGRPKLAVDNLGNTKVTASLSGNDNGDHLSYDLHPGNVQIEPGRAAFVKATLKPRQITWFGSKEERPYTIEVKRSGVTPLAVEGTYVQRSFLPGWLATALGICLALAITFVMLWIAYQPRVISSAKELQEAGVSTLPPPLPTPQPSAPSVAAPPAESPQAPAEPPPAEEADGGGNGDSDAGDAKPPPAKPKPPAAPRMSNIMLRNTTTKMCVDLPAPDDTDSAGRVVQAPCDEGSATQRWNLEQRYAKGAFGGAPLLQIRNVKDQKCVDLGTTAPSPSGPRSWSTPVTERPPTTSCGGSPNRRPASTGSATTPATTNASTSAG